MFSCARSQMCMFTLKKNETQARKQVYQVSTIIEKMNLPKAGHLEIDITLSADVQVSAFVAKQKVNRFLATEVGNLLHAGEPSLALADTIYWHVPVLLSLPSVGRVGQVGEIDVDVESGEVKIEPSLIESISRNAELLAARSSR